MLTVKDVEIIQTIEGRISSIEKIIERKVSSLEKKLDEIEEKFGKTALQIDNLQTDINNYNSLHDDYIGLVNAIQVTRYCNTLMNPPFSGEYDFGFVVPAGGVDSSRLILKKGIF